MFFANVHIYIRDIYLSCQRNGNPIEIKLIREKCCQGHAPPRQIAPSEVVPLHQPRCPEGATRCPWVDAWCLLHVFCMCFVCFVAICVVFGFLWCLKKVFLTSTCKYCEKPPLDCKWWNSPATHVVSLAVRRVDRCWNPGSNKPKILLMVQKSG